MKGSIRIMAGFFIAFGAVGTMDYDPAANVLTQTALALVGLAIMAVGVSAMKEANGY